jgi:hypothetical protein
MCIYRAKPGGELRGATPNHKDTPGDPIMKRALSIAVTCGFMAATNAALAGTVSLSLGQSSQDFTSIGVNNGGYLGYQLWDLEQGSCTGSASTTCTLSGSFTSSVSGLLSGNWSFVTTYSGPPTGNQMPQGIAEAYFGNGTNPNEFNYVFISTSTSMTLTLQSAGKNYIIPMVTDGNFDTGIDFSFAYTGTETCTGLPSSTPCELSTVGLVAGATITGPDTMSVSFRNPISSSVPEPATFGLLGLGLAGIGLARRRRHG